MIFGNFRAFPHTNIHFFIFMTVRKSFFFVLFATLLGGFIMGEILHNNAFATPDSGTGPGGETVKIKGFFNYIFNNPDPSFQDPDKILGSRISAESLEGNQIKNETITSSDILNGTIDTVDVKDGIINFSKLNTTMCSGSQLLSFTEGAWKCIGYDKVGLTKVHTQTLTGGFNPFIGEGTATTPLGISPTVIQRRITGEACASGSFISDIQENGTKTCTVDGDFSSINEIQDVIPGRGLEKDAGTNKLGMRICDANDKILSWNTIGNTWECKERLSGVPNKIREGSSDFTINNTTGNVGIGLGVDGGGNIVYASEKLKVGGDIKSTGKIIADGIIQSVSTIGGANGIQTVTTKDYVDAQDAKAVEDAKGGVQAGALTTSTAFFKINSLSTDTTPTLSLVATNHRDLLFLNSSDVQGSGILFTNQHADNASDSFGISGGGSNAQNSGRLSFWYAGNDGIYQKRLLTLEKSGKVGIGVDTPATTLHVGSTVSASGNNSNAVAVKISPSFNDGSFTGVSHTALLADSGNIIVQSGKLGIGTNAPSSALHIQDGGITLQGTATHTITENAGTLDIISPSINIGKNTGNSGRATFSDGNIAFYTGNNTKRMEINNVGDVLVAGSISEGGTPLSTKYQSSIVFPNNDADPCDFGVKTIGNDGNVTCVTFDELDTSFMTDAGFAETKAQAKTALDLAQGGTFDSTMNLNGQISIGIGTNNPETNLEFGGDFGDKIYLMNVGGADKYGFGVSPGELPLTNDLNIFSGINGDIKLKTGGSSGETILALRSNGNAEISKDVVFGGTLKTKSGVEFKCDDNEVLTGFDSDGPICSNASDTIIPVWQ